MKYNTAHMQAVSVHTRKTPHVGVAFDNVYNMPTCYPQVGEEGSSVYNSRHLGRLDVFVFDSVEETVTH